MSYKTLFEIQVFHHYFLDSGQDMFDVQNPVEHNSAYTISQFLEIMPLSKTALFLKNHRWLFKRTPFGIAILLNSVEEEDGIVTKEKPLITPIASDKLVFEIRVTDPLFYNYTDIADLNDLRLYHFSNSPVGGVDNIYGNSGNNTVGSNFLLSVSETKNLLENLAPLEGGINPHDLEHALDVLEKDQSISDLGQAKSDVLSNEVKRKRRQGVIGYIELDFSNNQSGERLLEHDTTGNPRYLDGNPHLFKLSFINATAFWKYHIHHGDNMYQLETQALKKFSQNGYTDIDPDTDLDATNQLSQAGASASVISAINSINFPNAHPQNLRLEVNKIYSDIHITI